jgi:hypothetical protein
MFIGHFAVAEALQQAAPEVPLWVSLTGVSFPDLMWGLTVVAGIEQVEINPNSPLIKDIRFVRYPYSHSLVLTNLIACIPAAFIGYFYGSMAAAIVFLAASISHWLLDTVVHLPDLPVLGFGADVKVGFGLWRYGGLAFAVEYLLLAAATVIFVPRQAWAPVLVAGALLHALNANAFFGFTKTNPTKSTTQLALLTLFGFILAIAAFQWALS